MNNQLKGSVAAWISWPEEVTVDALLRHDKPSVALSAIVLSEYDMSVSGWVKVGTAKVTVTFDNHDEVVTRQVAALRVELDEMRAELHAKQTALLARINNLLALEAV